MRCSCHHYEFAFMQGTWTLHFMCPKKRHTGARTDGFRECEGEHPRNLGYFDTEQQVLYIAEHAGGRRRPPNAIADTIRHELAHMVAWELGLGIQEPARYAIEHAFIQWRESAARLEDIASALTWRSPITGKPKAKKKAK